MKCEIKYLDIDGNPSKAYYDNVDSKGHEEARRIYLKEMSQHAYAKLQRVPATDEEILNQSKNLSLTSDEEYYRIFGSEKNLDRATSFISLVQDGFNSNKIADEVTRRDIAKDILSRDLAKFQVSPREFKSMSKMEYMDIPGIQNAVDEFIQNNPDLYQRSIDNLISLWDWKRESGTEIHEALEWYVTERNKLVKDEYGNKDYASAREITLQKLKAANVESSIEDYESLIIQIEEFLSSLGSDFKFETEVKVYDEELGVAGTIDLLAIDGQGTIRIFDYKTKEINKEHLFDYKGDLMMKEPLGHLHDNKANLGGLQTSLYRLILERQGRKVSGAEIIYIEAKVDENEKGEKVYKGFKKKTNKVLINHRSDLGKMFMKYKNIDIDKDTRRDKEDGKLNDSSDIIYELAGKNDFNEFKDIESSILRILYDAKINDRTGREYFQNRITGKPENFKSDNVDERKTQIREYLMKMKGDKDKLASNFMKFYYKGEGQEKWPDGNGNAFLQAKKIIGRVNKHTHDLQQLKSVYGFEDANPNVLIAINIKDRSAKIIFLGGIDSHNVKFEQEDEVDENGKVTKRVFDSNAKTTVAGNIMSDKAFKKRFGFNGLKATDNNFKTIQAGIIAIQLQEKGHIKGVESIVAGTVDGFSNAGKDKNPTITSMNMIMPNIKAIVELTKDKQSKYLSKILNNRLLLSADTYNVDYRKAMLSRITDEFLGIKNLDFRNSLEETLELHIEGEIRDAELLKSLILTQNILVDSLKSQGKATNKEDLAKDDEYLLLSNTIAQVANINMSIGSMTQKLSIESKARTTGRIASEAIRQLDSRVKSTELAINRDFKKFHSEHKELVKKLIEDSNMSGITNIDMHEIFIPLYRIDPNKPISSKNTGDLFHLKDPSDPSLTKNQSNYIKFFNDKVLDGYGYIFSDYRMEGLKNGETWENGRIPLMTASEENKIARDKDRNAVKELTKNQYTKKIKKDTETFNELSTRLHNDFNQQSKTGFQGGGTRQNMLGLRPDGSIKGEPNNLETNLESILNRFMSGNMRSHHYEITLGVYNAMNIIATVDTKDNFNDSSSVKDFMDEYIKLIVFNEYEKSESKLVNAVDITQKTMTMMSLGFSPRQILLEGATNTFASISSMMSQQLLSLSGQKRFGMGDWGKAGVIASTNRKLSTAIVNEFGLYGSDSEALGSKDFMETRKKFWFQSKWAYTLNNAPYRMFKTQVFIAELNNKGIMPAISHVDGVMKYDITKDKRFTTVIKNGKLLPKNKRVTDTEKDQGALLDSFIKDMYQEGNLDENGLPNAPLAYKDINAMKHYSMKLFGSVDKDARVLAQKNIWGRMLWKFKNWAIAKKDNWWTTTDGKLSELAGRRIKQPVLDENGNPIEGEFTYEFVDMSDMGVLQVLGELWDGLQTFKSLKKSWGDLDLNQRDTLIKGLTDLLLFAMLTAIFLQLMDMALFQKGPGKLAMGTLINSTADLNVFMMGKSMMGSNPFAVVGYAERTMSNLFKVVVGSATGNFKDIDHNFYSLWGGLGKTVESFKE